MQKPSGRILAVLALCCACAAQRTPPPGTGPGWVTLPSGGRLYYEIAGKGDTIVVPGAVYWSHALQPLTKSHTVIFYDLLGRGRSDTASASRIVIDSIVQDLEALRQFFRMEKMNLLGLSVSGMVAPAYAIAHPDRVTRLALINPIAPTADAQTSYRPPERTARIDSSAQREMARLRANGGSQEAICRQFWKASGGWFVGDRASASRIDPTWCGVPNESLDAPLLWLGYLTSTAGNWDLTGAARAIKAQTLVVQAERDYFANPAGAKAWAAAIPGARLLMLPGLGHLALFENPDAVTAPLQEFFAGRWPAGAAATASR